MKKKGKAFCSRAKEGRSKAKKEFLEGGNIANIIAKQKNKGASSTLLVLQKDEEEGRFCIYNIKCYRKKELRGTTFFESFLA